MGKHKIQLEPIPVFVLKQAQTQLEPELIKWIDEQAKILNISRSAFLRSLIVDAKWEAEHGE